MEIQASFNVNINIPITDGKIPDLKGLPEAAAVFATAAKVFTETMSGEAKALPVNEAKALPAPETQAVPTPVTDYTGPSLVSAP